MNSTITDIRKGIDSYWASPEGIALKLRLNLAELIICRLHENGWTQRALARKIGWHDSFLSRLIHGDENWTTETAGQLLFALEVDAELVEAKGASPQWRFHGEDWDAQTIPIQSSTAHGKESYKQGCYKEESSASPACFALAEACSYVGHQGVAEGI